MFQETENNSFSSFFFTWLIRSAKKTCHTINKSQKKPRKQTYIFLCKSENNWNKKYYKEKQIDIP